MKQGLIGAVVAVLAVGALVISIASWNMVRGIDGRLKNHEAALQQSVSSLNEAVKQSDLKSKEIISSLERVAGQASVQTANLQEKVGALAASAGQFDNTVKASVASVDKSAAGFSQAAGELKAIYIPQPATVQQIEAMEHRIADKSAWPGTTDDAQKFRAELKSLTDSLTPLVQDAVLPRLIPLRWSVQALLVVRSNSPVEESKAENAMTAFDSLLDAEPETASKEVHELIVSSRQEAEQKALAFRRSTAIEQARKALDAGNVDSLSVAWAALDGLPNKDDGMHKLQGEVRAKIIAQEIQIRTAELRQQLASLDSISDENTRQLGFIKVSEAAATYKLALLLDASKAGTPAGDLDNVLDEIEVRRKGQFERQQEKYAAANRAYQQWALQEIRKFNSAYDTAEWEVNEQGFGRRTWRDEHYKEVRDAMVEHIAPISANHLDTAVAQLYQKAFQRGWSKLEGREDQLYVAEQSAKAEKKLPNSNLTVSAK